MTNSQFTKLLRRAAAALTKHRRLLIEAQDEYQRRYGELPGEHDNDSWIDSLEGGGGEGNGSITAAMVDEWAVASGRDSWMNSWVTNKNVRLSRFCFISDIFVCFAT